MFCVTASTETVHCGGLWGWVSGRAETHLGLQCRFVPKDVIGIHWLDLGLYGKVWGAFQSHGIALFGGIFLVLLHV